MFLVHLFVCLFVWGLFLCLLPALCSVFMHGLLCFYLFGLSKLLLQIQFPFIIHPAHSSLQPCSLLFSLTGEHEHCTPGYRAGWAGSSWSWEHGLCLGRWWPGPLPSPARSRAAGGPHCKPSKPQQSTESHAASLAHEEHKGQIDDLLALRSQASVSMNGIVVELPRETPGEHAKGRRLFPRSLAAKCVSLYCRLAAWFFSSDL